MSISLKDIIQECYLKVRNSEINSFIHSKYQIAGMVLGEMYNIYENSKDKELLIEIKFFLDLKNVIKHLINILNNSGDQGTMTVNNAIIHEYKLIENSREVFDISTPFSIIEDSIKVVNHNEMRNTEYKKVIIERIINRMIDDRMIGKLNNDGVDLLSQDNLYELIEIIIDRIILGEEIRISINEVFQLVEDKKKDKENAIQIMKFELLEEFKTLITEIHGHIDHVGKSTFEAITSTSPEQKPIHHGKNKIPTLFS